MHDCVIGNTYLESWAGRLRNAQQRLVVLEEVMHQGRLQEAELSAHVSELEGSDNEDHGDPEVTGPLHELANRLAHTFKGAKHDLHDVLESWPCLVGFRHRVSVHRIPSSLSASTKLTAMAMIQLEEDWRVQEARQALTARRVRRRFARRGATRGQ